MAVDNEVYRMACEEILALKKVLFDLSHSAQAVLEQYDNVVGNYNETEDESVLSDRLSADLKFAIEKANRELI